MGLELSNLWYLADLVSKRGVYSFMRRIKIKRVNVQNIVLRGQLGLNQHLRKHCRSVVKLSSTLSDSTPMGSISCDRQRRSWVECIVWSTRQLPCIWCALRNQSIRVRWCKLWWVCASGRIATWCWRCTLGTWSSQSWRS